MLLDVAELLARRGQLFLELLVLLFGFDGQVQLLGHFFDRQFRRIAQQFGSQPLAQRPDLCFELADAILHGAGCDPPHEAAHPV